MDMIIGTKYTFPNDAGFVTYNPKGASRICGEIVYFTRAVDIVIVDYIETHDVYLHEVVTGDKWDGSLFLITPQRLQMIIEEIT